LNFEAGQNSNKSIRKNLKKMVEVGFWGENGAGN
jgi:hypothetical protein